MNLKFTAEKGISEGMRGVCQNGKKLGIGRNFAYATPRLGSLPGPAAAMRVSDDHNIRTDAAKKRGSTTTTGTKKLPMDQIERRRAASRRSYQKHRLKHAARYRMNRLAILARQKARRDCDPVKHRKYMRRYRADHHAHILELERKSKKRSRDRAAVLKSTQLANPAESE